MYQPFGFRAPLLEKLGIFPSTDESIGLESLKSRSSRLHERHKRTEQFSIILDSISNERIIHDFLSSCLASKSSTCVANLLKRKSHDSTRVGNTVDGVILLEKSTGYNSPYYLLLPLDLGFDQFFDCLICCRLLPIWTRNLHPFSCTAVRDSTQPAHRFQDLCGVC